MTALRTLPPKLDLVGFLSFRARCNSAFARSSIRRQHFSGDRVVLRRWCYIHHFPLLGAPQGRCCDDLVFNGQEEDYMVELFSIWVPFGAASLCFVLSANLFPGCQGRISNFKCRQNRLLSPIGSALVSIANGLLSTFFPGTSTGEWIGYQIIAGVGRGLALQIPIIAVQNTLAFPLIPNAMALLMFSQSFVGAIFLSFSDTIFTNSLHELIPKYAPSVNPQAIVNAGATGFRAKVSATELVGVLAAYS
ncbi:hypothetical protein TSTA_017040 [Talaromyces stipitatus ATCC 10500]|uniref:Uncharacterized protein n=1 Tax=Talaromyces stipitatus (strain ATCC 10500 / CBS 375.48 / QM 6759 / NRRL 1006) TaxID=441959 RepID=B8MEK2_TALSN|nr:uncharacterized protein TSTA_017040 [Talaromyces stipitatus ATCC 10500]EED16629.1 hypothetical protein TSTA_017040 [Talaromyces stipitatus ATCC 10500]